MRYLKTAVYNLLLSSPILLIGWFLHKSAVISWHAEQRLFLFGLLLTLLLLALATLLAIKCRNHQKIEVAAHLEMLRTMRLAMDKSALRYKNLLEDAGEAIFVINADSGMLEEVNRMGTELLGYSKEELAALNSKHLIHSDDKKKFTALVRRVKQRRMASSGSMVFRRKNGTTFLGEINARLISLGDGQVVHAIIRDITHKSRVEKELKQRNRELSILNDLIARANQNLQLQTVLDLTLQETIDIFGADGGGIHLQEYADQTLQLAARKHLSAGLEAELERSDLQSGIFGQIAETGHHYTTADLGHAGFELAASTVSEGWKSFAGVPLFAKDRLVGIMHILTRSERQFTSDEMKLLTSIANQIGHIIEHARLFAELSWKTEELLRSHHLLEKSSHRLALSQNRLKNNLEVVEKANLELEQLDKMKSHFLGMISHEFKTPLTTIMGGTEFLLTARGPAREPEEQKILEMVLKGGARLNEIVNDLLKLAKLEAKTPTLAKTDLQLTEIFDLLLVQLDPLLKERNLHVQLTDMAAIPYFSGDREYLEEIFAELLENAIKFTPDGREIAISARIVTQALLEEKRQRLAAFHASFFEQMKDGSYLEVKIQDAGIGIDSGEQLKIFDKFYEVGDIRHHSSSKYQFQGKGAGLGLAIVKGMVEAHGGMVWVESSGVNTATPGSSFFILLPLEEGHHQPGFYFMEAGVPYAQPNPFR